MFIWCFFSRSMIHLFCFSGCNQFTMLGTPVDPAKKRKIDINVSLCIICQEEGPSSKKCTTPNVDTLKKVLDLAKERFSNGNSTVKDFYERVESTSAEELKENNFFGIKIVTAI